MHDILEMHRECSMELVRNAKITYRRKNSKDPKEELGQIVPDSGCKTEFPSEQGQDFIGFILAYPVPGGEVSN